MELMQDVVQGLLEWGFLPNPRRLVQLPLLFPTSSQPNNNNDNGISLYSGLSCEHPQLSCPIQLPPSFNECCLNAPSGHFLSTQFWDTSPSLGANDSWTLHGLWPDYCSGGFEQFCDDNRSKSQEEIEAILKEAANSTHPDLLNFMNEHWLSYDSRDSHLWTHEWNKHGTCISTLKPKCYSQGDDDGDGSSLASTGESARDVLDYFTHATSLYSSLDTFAVLAEKGIVPSYENTYSLVEIQKAVEASQHGYVPTFKCNSRHELQEVWYHFLVRGSLRDANNTADPNEIFISTKADGQLSNCPATGIKYVPKSPRSAPPYNPPDDGDRPSPGPNPNPFSGRGYLKVRVLSDDSGMGGGENERKVSIDGDTKESTSSSSSYFTGCLIRPGTWYTSGACARYTAKTDVNQQEFNQPEVKEENSNQMVGQEEDPKDHLFTLQSSYAPCSIIEDPKYSSSPDDMHRHYSTSPQKGKFTCQPHLPIQSIFGVMNSSSSSGTSTSTNPKSTADAAAAVQRVLSYRGSNIFYASKIPAKFDKVDLFVDDDGGTRKIQVEIHWEALSD